MQFEGIVAGDQLLAVRQADIVGSAVLDIEPHIHALIDLLDDVIALIEQTVRLLAAAGAREGDFLVEPGELLGEIVDLGDFVFDLAVDTVLHVLQVTVEGAKLRGHDVCGAEHALARSRVGGTGGEVFDTGEEILHQRREPGLAVGEQIVDLTDLSFVRLQAAGVAERVVELIGDELIELTLDLVDLHATADGVLAEDGHFPVVTGRVDVADIVAGGVQRVLGRVEATEADGIDAHVVVSVSEGVLSRFDSSLIGRQALNFRAEVCRESSAMHLPGGYRAIQVAGWGR